MRSVTRSVLQLALTCLALLASIAIYASCTTPHPANQPQGGGVATCTGDKTHGFNPIGCSQHAPTTPGGCWGDPQRYGCYEANTPYHEVSYVPSGSDYEFQDDCENNACGRRLTSNTIKVGYTNPNESCDKPNYDEEQSTTLSQ